MTKNMLSPKEIAYEWVEIGKRKANFSNMKVILLGLLGGLFVGLGAHADLVVIQTMGQTMDIGLAKFMGAAVFPVGIMLVVIAGAELFTGNNLVAVSFFAKKVTLGQMLKNWMLVYFANLIGALILVILLYKSGLYKGTLAEMSIHVAEGKVGMTFTMALIRGTLCNILVALSVWISSATDDVAGKILALWFPVMLFVLSGFEHSVANMFFLPLGALLGADISISDMIINNFIPVTLGNILGGAGVVSFIYWFVYVKREN